MDAFFAGYDVEKIIRHINVYFVIRFAPLNTNVDRERASNFVLSGTHVVTTQWKKWLIHFYDKCLWLLIRLSVSPQGSTLL